MSVWRRIENTAAGYVISTARRPCQQIGTLKNKTKCSKSNLVCSFTGFVRWLSFMPRAYVWPNPVLLIHPKQVLPCCFRTT